MVGPRHYQLREMLKSRSIQRVLDQILGLCDSQTLFLDIGANIGIFSLFVSSETGAFVIAFEPVFSTFHALVRNVNCNPSLKVIPLNVALGASSNLIEITAVSCSGTNQVSTVAEREGEPLQTSFQLALDHLSLDSVAKEFQRIVVKIDVERYEFEVLNAESIETSIPIVVCVEADCMQLTKLHSILPPGFRMLDLLRPIIRALKFKVNMILEYILR